MVVVLRRPAIREDFVSLANLAAQLAKYHQEELSPNPDKLIADASWYSASIISVDSADVGFAGWHHLYACQSAERGIELQNLYVNKKHRGQKLGIRLVLEVVRDAIGLECAEIKIGLRKENVSALEFYKKLGCSITDRNDSWRCKIKRHRFYEIISQAEKQNWSAL
jgi:ribosomal protein S18 acetylase RimI-like enzyme